VKYLLLIYQNATEWSALPEAERTAVMHEAGELWSELLASGEAVMGAGLGAQAHTVRVRAGTPAITDGPYLEAKEQLAGFTLIDVESEQRALDIAARWPDARHWAMEVRPVPGTVTPD
jgi:hypothetical protein